MYLNYSIITFFISEREGKTGANRFDDESKRGKTILKCHIIPLWIEVIKKFDVYSYPIVIYLRAIQKICV